MARAMRTSRQGLELIKSFEGFRSHAVCLGDARWMIGYGHTAKARKGLKISRGDAELILRKYDLPPIEAGVTKAVLAPLNQNEFDALISFVFNIGLDAFKASRVLSHLNSGERLIAAEEMSAWRKARVNGKLILVDALVRRRAAERALFLEHPSGRASIPSAIVRPEIDVTASIMTPRESATVIHPRYEGGRASVGEEGKPSPRPGETSRRPATPEAAVVQLKKRLTRILGETGAAVPRPDETRIDGSSVEEITDAIKDLAGAEEDERPPVPQHDNDSSDDPAPLVFGKDDYERRISPRTPPPPFDETLDLTDPVLPPIEDDDEDWPPASAPVIDDLEVIQPSREEMEAAQREYAKFESEERAGKLLGWLPYALLSLLGFAGMIWGARDFMHLARKTAANADHIATAGERYFGPYLILGGGILFVLAGYYLWRALRR